MGPVKITIVPPETGSKFEVYIETDEEVTSISTPSPQKYVMESLRTLGIRGKKGRRALKKPTIDSTD